MYLGKSAIGVGLVAALLVNAPAFAPAYAGVAITCQQGSVTAASGELLGCDTGQFNTGFENILFSDHVNAITGPATTLIGIGSKTGVAIDFTSMSDILKVNNGQGGDATINSDGDNLVNNLTYSIAAFQPFGVNATGFTVLDTNLDVRHPSGIVQFAILIKDSNGFRTLVSNDIKLTNGGNKFEFDADIGTIIKSVTYNTSNVSGVTIEGVKQTQITIVDPPADPVPEPATLTLLSTVLLGMAGFMRYRNRA
jgi:hypothetical protein